MSDPSSNPQDALNTLYPHRDPSVPKPINLAGSRIASNSVLYTKLVPIVLAVLGMLTIVQIVIAAGILLGFVPLQ